MTAGGISADAGTGFDREYSYDSIGNITKLEETYNDPTTTRDDRFVRSYNYGAGTAGPHAVTSVTDPNNPNFAYSYDQAGQMTSRNVGNGAQTITYDPLGQTDSLTDNGVVTKFRYDTNGIRARQQVGTVDTLYAGQWWEQTGTDITKYYFVNGELTGLSADGDVRYVFKDQLDGVANTLNLDAGGLGHLRNRFHPFGEPRNTLEVTETDLGYTGQRRDGSGLMYYNARYYDPLTARFTQADTIIPNPANPQDLNRYTYVRNNPIKYNDPTGNDPCLGGGGGCGGVREGDYNGDGFVVLDNPGCEIWCAPEEIFFTPGMKRDAIRDLYDWNGLIEAEPLPVEIGIEARICPVFGCVEVNASTTGVRAAGSIGLIVGGGVGFEAGLVDESDSEAESGFYSEGRRGKRRFLASYGPVEYQYEYVGPSLDSEIGESSLSLNVLEKDLIELGSSRFRYGAELGWSEQLGEIGWKF